MTLKRWIARRETDWRQLDTLLQQAEKRGLRSLGAEQIKQLASLYRAVSADLARAQTREVGQVTTQSLQQLTSRAYAQIYQQPRRQDIGAIGEFYRWGLPAVIQETGLYIALATGIFLLGSLVGWWFAWGDPAFLTIFLPDSLIRKVQEDRELWMGSILGVEPIAASNIMMNNLRVAFNAVGGGIVAGVFTVYILFFNGLMIGAVGTLIAQNQLAWPFWAFVFPHGSLELPAIFLAGGAGLLIARGLLFPGQYTRLDALKRWGLKAAQLVCGIIPMLVIAGVIEGFFSPSPLVPAIAKYLFGTLLFAALLAYCGRKRP